MPITKMNFRLVLVAVFLSLAFSSIQAQSLLALRYPFGLPVAHNSGMSQSMGGAGIGVEGDYNVMLFNPANLGSIEKTVFSTLFSLDFTQISESGAHTNLLAGFPREISFGIPFGKFGTLGASFEQQSNFDARFQSGDQEVEFNESSVIVDYKPGIFSAGGIISWQVGWGKEFEKLGKLKLGIGYDHVYFSHAQSMVNTITTTVTGIDPVAINSRDSTSIRSSASGVRLGAAMPVGKLRLGASGEYFFASTANVTNGVFTQNDSGALAATSQSATIRIVPTLGFGASYLFSQEWMAALDVSATLWKYYKSGGILTPVDRSAALSYSLGGQYIPAPNLLMPKYWETIHYRSGLRFTELPAKGSYEYALMLGVGLPTGKGAGAFDLGIELGKRQDTRYSQYAENFFNISLGINGGRKWSKSQMGNY